MFIKCHSYILHYDVNKKKYKIIFLYYIVQCTSSHIYTYFLNYFILNTLNFNNIEFYVYPNRIFILFYRIFNF